MNLLPATDHKNTSFTAFAKTVQAAHFTPPPPPRIQRGLITHSDIYRCLLPFNYKILSFYENTPAFYGVRIYYGLTGPASDKHRFRLTTGPYGPMLKAVIFFSLPYGMNCKEEGEKVFRRNPLSFSFPSSPANRRFNSTLR
ncbi:MAG: hypothetical protein LBC31_05310 [Treponema sp.]|jgi:hypothetical protein|nr:hypothetical protein [Treponema sp.]